MNVTITNQAISNDMMAFLKGISSKTGKPMSKLISSYEEAKNSPLQNIPEPFDSRELREFESMQQHNAELSY